VRVAPPKPDCTICQQPERVRIPVNAAIWDEQTGRRTKAYRSDAVTLLADFDVRLEAKSVTRHADHVEASWRDTTPAAPAAGREEALFATDFASVTDEAANLGMKAMATLSGRVETMADKDLIATAKLGVGASTARATHSLKRAELGMTAAAIFGLAAGMAEVPESEIVNVTPVADLLAEVADERRTLLIAAGNEV
jgi:hypothetical protein